MLEVFNSISEQDLALVFSSFWLSAKLALLSTLILLFFCTPLAWYLSRREGWLKYLLQAVFSLPLVLPPSVLGFYLLVLFRPDAFIGELWFELTETQLLFSFNALLLASVVYSLPFVFQPLLNAFEQNNPLYFDLAKTLGASRSQQFFSVLLPVNRRAYLVAFVLGFAHTLGEFGVVLLVGGNIAGETRVISIAIYEQVELMNYDLAHFMAFFILLVSLLLLVPVYAMNGSLLKFSERLSFSQVKNDE
jgi:molybdate transport system permease protein